MAFGATPEAVIHRFTAFLDDAGIPYMLTGSFASGFHGAPRATQDIDFVISPTLGSLQALLSRLPEESFYVSREAALDAYGRESLFNVIDFDSGWKVDFICRKSRPFSIEEFHRRTTRQLAGVQIFVTTPEDTILSKLEWAKLAESERQLEDVAGVLNIQGDKLDIEYIERWVVNLELQSVWAHAKRIAG